MDVNPNLLDAINKPYLGVLGMIIKQMNKENNVWHSNKGNHLDIITRLDIKQPTLEKHLRTLKEKKILLHRRTDGRGVYTVNSQMLRYNG